MGTTDFAFSFNACTTGASAVDCRENEPTAIVHHVFETREPIQVVAWRRNCNRAMVQIRLEWQNSILVDPLVHPCSFFQDGDVRLKPTGSCDTQREEKKIKFS